MHTKRIKKHQLLLSIAICAAISNPISAQRVDQGGEPYTIKPSVVRLEKNNTTQFKIIKNAQIKKPASLVTDAVWYVNGIKGGNSVVGTIDVSGLYKAPSVQPNPKEIHIMGITGDQKVFATVLMGADQPFYKSVFQYAEKRDTTKHFGNPHGVALDKDGNLVIVDADKHFVMRFSPKGKLLGYIGKTGQEDGEFHSPRVVLLHPNSDLFISDQKEFGNRIQIFSSDGKFKKSFAPHGNGEGQLLRAHGMNFDSKGNLFVVDVDNSKVTKFDAEGNFQYSFGEDGPYKHQLNAPHGLAVDPNDNVFICGYYGTIQKFDSKGNYIKSFAEGNPPDHSVYIHAISGDQYGNVYSMVRGQRGYGGRAEISKGKIYSIEKFNNNGDFLYGINLSVNTHSENWVFVDEKGYLYALYRGKDIVGFEILAPL